MTRYLRPVVISVLTISLSCTTAAANYLWSDGDGNLYDAEGNFYYNNGDNSYYDQNGNYYWTNDDRDLLNTPDGVPYWADDNGGFYR